MPEAPRLLLIIGFGLLTVSMFFGISKTINYQGIEEFYRHNFGEFSVAIGTVVLGIFTAYLGLIEIDEGKKERRRLRLKEQLGLYSIIIGRITEKEEWEFEKIFDVSFVIERYEYLASEKLRDQLREFYKYYRRKIHGGYKDFVKEVGEEEAKEIKAEKLKLIKQTIYSDYESLLKEYNELTKK